MSSDANATIRNGEVRGVNPQAVIDAITSRGQLQTASAPADDSRKIGLVIEGGSLRGVMSAGGLIALSRMGYDGVFDHVFATSAGAMNAAYFLSRQADLGISIYYEDLASKAFIHPWRFWKILDLDFVFDVVVSRLKPLDVEAIRNSRTRFSVTMIDLRTGQSKIVDAAHGPESTVTCLKAATAIPVLYNRAVMVEGAPCIDGGMLHPLLVREAIDAGCTDILVLLTQPADYVRIPSSWFGRALFKTVCARGRPSLSRLIDNYPAVDREARLLALGEAAPPGGVNIAAICPASNETVHGLAIDGQEMWRAAVQYCRRTLHIFGRDDIEPAIAPPRQANG